MPKTIKPLTDAEIKALKPKNKDYRVSASQGLYVILSNEPNLSLFTF